MSIGIAGHEIETMIVAGSQRGLQTVVCRSIKIRKIVDVVEIGILRSERLRGAAVYDIRLIEIHNSYQPRAVVTHVSGFQGKLAGESMLDAQRPIFNVGGAEVAIHGEGVARAGVRDGIWIRDGGRWHLTITALDQSGHAGGIDSGGLILPGEAGPRDRYAGGHEVSRRIRHDWHARSCLATGRTGDDCGAC